METYIPKLANRSILGPNYILIGADSDSVTKHADS